MKNPFLSMWLSAANTAAGSARGLLDRGVATSAEGLCQGLRSPGLQEAASCEAPESPPEVNHDRCFLPQGSPPASAQRLFLSAEPHLASLLVDPRPAVVFVERHMVDALA